MGAVREFKRGNSQNVNRFLRFRVVAQGATVAAMLIGSVIYEKTAALQKENDQKAERERMFQILDSVGHPQPPVVASPVAALSEPTVSVENLPPKEGKASLPLVEPRRKGAQYVGSNDQWKEYFDQKNKAAETSLPPKAAAEISPAESKTGWGIWRSK